MDSFKHSKGLGQNFLRDGNLLRAIVLDSGASELDTVVEVGAGMGALTKQLVLKSGRVFSYEVDPRLAQPLTDMFSDCDNLTLCFTDILKQDPAEVRKMLGDRYKVVANLPYYITTPLLFYFIEQVGGAESFTVMVQREVADRFTAECGSKLYGAVTVALSLEFDVKKTRNVSRKMFDPVPNVDSAVVHLQRREPMLVPSLRALVRQSFGMRRKTLVNNLACYGKDKVLNALNALGIDPAARAEVLTVEQFKRLHSILL